MSRRLLLLLWILGGAAPALRSEETDLTPETARLATALETIRADRISADVHFVASDEMRGRDTPSSGQRITARFLRQRLQRLGILPGSTDGYLYTYELVQRRVRVPETHVVVQGGDGEVALDFGEDYFFATFGAETGTQSGGVAFGGTGSEEDLEGLDLTGRWVLCLDSDLSWRRRRSAVRESGALGLIVTPGPDYDGEPYTQRYAMWIQRALQGRVAWPAEAGEADEHDARPARSSFPTLSFGVAAGRLLLGDGPPPAPGTELPFQVTDVRDLGSAEDRVQVENVCGLWPGSDSRLAKEVLLVSAHYDHIGLTVDGEVNNGADDNGSGTCGLLALAEALVEYGPLRRSVALLWVSGEERGLLGSRAWSGDPRLPAGYGAVANINIDMIGRNAPDQLLITPTRKHEQYNGLTRLIESLGAHEGFTDFGSADDYYRRSDQAMFARLGIPVVFLFADVHEDYHQPTDDADKLDYDKVRRTMRLVLRTLQALQGDELGV